MEQVIVALAVGAAAFYLVLRLARRRRASRAPRPACAQGCAGCPLGTAPHAPLAERRAPCPPPATRLGVALALAASATLFPSRARAADTIEVWEPGAADVELYAGVDGLGRLHRERVLHADAVLGVGLTRRISAYLTAALETDGLLAGATPRLGLGVFTTVFDSDLFDLDLLMEIDSPAASLDALELAPGLELNLDFGSPLGPWGLYLRAGVPVSLSVSRGWRAEHVFEATPGARWSFCEGHELLVEYALALHPRSAPALEHGGLALGYNATISESFELVTQLSLMPATDAHPTTAGILVGFVATMPAADSGP